MQEHIREVHEALPRGYYRELPEPVGGRLAGYPRVYEVAIALISHSEALIDLGNLDLFVSAYQSVTPLSIGELWALPAMFRIALIESVRRMTLRTMRRMREIETADAWAQRIETASEQGAVALGDTLDAFVEAPPLLTEVFIARFLHQLRLIRGAYLPLVEIEAWISERVLPDEVASARATQHLALTQVMMANSITSLRTIAQLDWRTFVERQSALEAVLRTDPAACHARMTFATRDHYRHVVERIARRTKHAEEDVARMAVALADVASQEHGPQHVRSHVGYYLVDEGRPELEAVAGYRARAGEALHRWVLRHPDAACKLAEFNRFLRGGAADAFTTIAGNVELLGGVRYVITLDADTVLPPGGAAELIGTIAHPLNRAVYDPAHGRVVRGYGILQPRVGVTLPSAHRSRFSAIHSGHPGVDPYTTATSDVYQDLFGEGSYTGKGIYDVDVFDQATHGRFPENTLLSHDLIEGSYARAGLVTSTIVYDDYPTRYLTFTRRKHRWIRGDWQLLRWLTPRVPGPDGPEANRLPLLSRWKIFDNLRRSTVEIGLVLFLFAGWVLLPGAALGWTALALAALAAPWVVSLLLAALRPPLDRSWRAYYASVGSDARTAVQQLALAIAFLPHQAWVSADAIIRTLWRLGVTKRRLLEWQTASTAERDAGTGRALVWRAIAPAAVVAVAMALIAIVRSTDTGLRALWLPDVLTTAHRSAPA